VIVSRLISSHASHARLHVNARAGSLRQTLIQSRNVTHERDDRATQAHSDPGQRRTRAAHHGDEHREARRRLRRLMLDALVEFDASAQDCHFAIAPQCLVLDVTAGIACHAGGKRGDDDTVQDGPDGGALAVGAPRPPMRRYAARREMSLSTVPDPVSR
jgi:hypothetical protein